MRSAPDVRMARRLVPVLALACVLALTACRGGEAELAGQYTATNRDGVALALHGEGKGTWTTPDEDLEFTWERRGQEVWMHTRDGGIIVGQVTPDGGITVRLPGAGRYEFTRGQ